MTPTLLGRWQTRLFLLSTVGSIASIPFAIGFVGPAKSFVYYWILLYLFLLGLAWDYLYNFLQQFMWDHDWPGIFQLFAAIIEGCFLVGLIKWVGLPHISHDLPLKWFVLHYGLVWTLDYLSVWVVMRIFFPRWRFRGGEWLGRWSNI